MATKQKSTNIHINLQQVTRFHFEYPSQKGKPEKIIDSSIIRGHIYTLSSRVFLKAKVNGEYEKGVFGTPEEDFNLKKEFVFVAPLGAEIEIEAYHVPEFYKDAVYIGKASFTANETSLQDGLTLENVTQKVTTEHKEFRR